ncbi:non-ribosomal peptide synthetase [Streptomyces sp. 5.8]|uniref:non-ribosomal peptide synthetase n=1 Tax=Streptomyces sp. 5.8 TaxID=3406571 RepID=UPI003BB77773
MPPLPAAPAGLPARIAEHARIAPDAVAVHDGTHSLTYGQLIDSARQLAGVLSASGVGPGSAVGLLMPHAVRTVVAQLAVWWAGGHYVPLDPAYPEARTAAMLRETGAALTLADPELLSGAPVLPGSVLELPELPLVPLAEELRDLPAGPPPYDPDATAYVIYTSGSTGRPKGIALTHRGVGLMATAPPCGPLRQEDRVLFHSPMAFDASAFEVWAPLAHGATVVVCASGRPAVEHLATEAAHLGVTVAFLTTSLFHHLAGQDSALFGLVRTVVTGGEALSGPHARRVLRARPALELVNAYGPTESTTFTTAHRVRDEDCDAPPPIGLPLPGVGAHVLNDLLREVPQGEAGELWLSGPRLAGGYVDRPELTAERFMQPAAGADPAEAPWGIRLYRTSDLVSVDADGVLRFLGRTDGQVKVRGHRIETGEVEHALHLHPGVRRAVVAVRRPSAEDARLTAYVVGAPGQDCSARTLRAHLTRLLPAHMVPGIWIPVVELPIALGGKVDHRALAALPLPTGPDDGPPTGPTPPPSLLLSPLQRTVAEAWSAALGVPVDRPEADFFALGGHSLLALCVLEGMRRDLGAGTSLAAFYADPTVAGHATLLAAALGDNQPEAAR